MLSVNLGVDALAMTAIHYRVSVYLRSLAYGGLQSAGWPALASISRAERCVRAGRDGRVDTKRIDGL
ncbi:MAG: hypothetical protein WAM94_06040 [Chromatiaceae bacterium]